MFPQLPDKVVPVPLRQPSFLADPGPGPVPLGSSPSHYEGLLGLLGFSGSPLGFLPPQGNVQYVDKGLSQDCLIKG